jgi:group I intron endonuclease
LARRKPVKRTHGVIYIVTNIVNGKQYVGYTVQLLKDRWKQHWKDAEAGRGWTLHAAIRKYGKDTFTVEAITELMPEHLLPQIEIFYIYLFKSLVSQGGYNVTRGGDGVPCTDEMRKKMSESQKRRGPITEETRKKLCAAQVGKTISPEQRVKLSLAMTGRKVAPEVIAKTVASNTGKKRSEATKKNMSDLSPKGEDHHMWGKSESPETKAKKSASLLKHFAANPREEFSQETRALMSAAKKNDPELMTRIQKLADAARGKVAHNRGAVHSEETKAKMKASWVLLNQTRAVAKVKLMVKAQLLALAPKEILV